MRSDHAAVRSLLVALLLVVGATVPAAAVMVSTDTQPATGVTVLGTMAAQETPENDSNVTVTVGQQLATVITVSSDEVHTDFENTAFELAVEHEGDEARAEAIAERAEALRDRAESIREDYDEATESYEAGEITKSEYAQRLASLNARATNLVSSYEQLSQRAQNVSDLELRVAGANLSSLDASLDDLSHVTGAGTSALLAQFLGEADGEIELETAGGLKIEIEREGGEFSREFERPRDDDVNITVSQSAALQTARNALSAPEEGHWVLTETKVKTVDGAYEFEFVLEGSSNLTGEAEVRVDGSTGDVYRLEQETEGPDDGEDERDEDDEREERDEDDERDELTLLVTDGTPAPNATITLQVLAGGQPAAGVSVAIGDHVVGTTDAHGRVVVTLPDAAEVELVAVHGEADGELEFEFDDAHEHETDRVFERLEVAATLDERAVTVEVRFDGEPVRNATVYANEDRVGETDADGIVSFDVDPNTTRELEIEVVKGEFEAELAYAIHDGSLVLTEEEHEGEEADDADDDEQEEDEDEREHDDDEDDREHDDETADADHRTLSMAIVHGTASPGATVTIEVSADGEPVEGATVAVDSEVVGETDANGLIEVTLPDDDSADLRATYGDLEARLEFDFDHEESDEPEED